MTVHFSANSTETEYAPAKHPLPDQLAATQQFYNLFVKRALDLTLALISMPVVFPTITLLAFIIFCRDGRNPFYSQLRIGRDGKPFRMWKLRTMIPDADRALQNHLSCNPEARHEWNKTQKLKDDPRITLIGRVLRKTSADELPQIFNVINGTMSWVGPRPMMLCQEKHYTGFSYYALRPGITGLWQVSDRNNSAFIDRVKFDEEYRRTLCLKVDALTLFRTIGAVIRGTGY
jgi:lipopolysaccharide/colanic/teichoic acid biosynthesis glycosyltransferase